MRLSRPRVVTSRDAEKLRAAAEAAAGDEVEAAASPPGEDPYFEKIVKYIPGEVVAAYEVGVGIIAYLHPKDLIHLGWVVFLAVVSYFWILYATERQSLGKQRFQAIAAVVAFLAWVGAIGGQFIPSYQQGFGSLILVAVTLLIPLAEKIFVR